MKRDVQRPEAHAAEPDVVSGALALARASAGVALGIRAILRAAAIYVAAEAWRGARKTLQVVVPEVRVHVAEAHDLGAEVAFGCAAAVGELVRGEA